MCLGLKGPGRVVIMHHWVPVLARSLRQVAIRLLWGTHFKSLEMSVFLSLRTCIWSLGGVALPIQYVFPLIFYVKVYTLVDECALALCVSPGGGGL